MMEVHPAEGRGISLLNDSLMTDILFTHIV